MKKILIILAILCTSLLSYSQDTTFVAVLKAGALSKGNPIMIDNGSGELIKDRSFVSSAQFIAFLYENYEVLSTNTVSVSVIPYFVIVYKTKKGNNTILTPIK